MALKRNRAPQSSLDESPVFQFDWNDMKQVFVIAAFASLMNPALAVPPPPQLARPAQIKQIPVPLARPALPQLSSPKRVPTLPPRPSNAENVKLLNGDTFSGQPKGFDPEKGLLWEHPHIKGTFPINPRSVARVNLGASKLPDGAKHHACNVMLANGDSFSGDLVGLNDKSLLVDTWYAGRVSVDRTIIKTLQPGFTAAKTLYDGPNDIKNWTFVNPNAAAFGQLPPNAPLQLQQQFQQRQEQMKNAAGNWKLNEGGFECTTSGALVGRNFKNLPAKGSLEFDIEWASYLNLYLNLHTDSLRSYSSANTYQLRLNQSYAYLYRYSTTRGSQRVGSNFRINLNSTQRRAHVAIKYDQEEKIFALFLNGKFVTKWQDVNTEFAGKGNGILFSSRSSSHMRVSRILLREWNGSLPGKNKASAGSDKEDFVLFNNEDSISGTLLGIDEGKMMFKTSFAELPGVPLQDVDTIHLAKEQLKTPPIMASSSRLNLKGSGRMSLQITSWKDGVITGRSLVFGELKVDAGAVQSIEFNLGKPRTASTTVPNPTTAHTTIQRRMAPQVLIDGNNVDIEVLRGLERKNIRLNIKR